MIGFNGGLIGKANLTVAGNSIPGVWTPREQEVGVRTGRWAGLAGVLDTYPAAIGYSLRALRASTANSAVVKVRRSSGSPSEQDFTASQITNGELAAWVGAGNNGFVTTWYDQSGSANHATQTDTAKQPRIVNAGVVETESGSPAIVWPSTSHSLTFAVRLTIIRTYILLARCSNSSLNSAPFLLGDSSDFAYHAGSSTWLDGGNAYPNVKNGDNRLNGIVTNFLTTNRNQLRYIFTMVHAGTVPASSLTQDRGGTSRSWIGPIQEVIIYTTDQTANRAAIEANITTHYF
jgi:hypothetical protein